MAHLPLNNSVDLWLDDFPQLNAHANKYDRGHALILAAPELTGATRLAASACSRIGSGLVTVLTEDLLSEYRVSLPPDIMVRECTLEEVSRVNVVLGGPGGISPAHFSALVENRLGVRRVIDADALDPDLLNYDFDHNTVLTPHDGEFERMFGRLGGTRMEQTVKAAQRLDCIIVRKGPKTIISHPDGRAVINDIPNPFLAKAGTGDVLAGIIAGLVAQGMESFKAAQAAVWIHSDAGEKIGPGLTSVDIEYAFPEILRELVYDIGFDRSEIDYTPKID